MPCRAWLGRCDPAEIYVTGPAPGCRMTTACPQFKRQAIQRVSNGHSVTTVARELGVTPQTLRNWTKQLVAGFDRNQGRLLKENEGFHG